MFFEHLADASGTALMRPRFALNLLQHICTADWSILRQNRYFSKILGTDIHVYTFCQFLSYNSNCKLITAGGSEKRILLNDTSTTLKMTSENVPLQICKRPFKMCGELFVRKCAGESSSENLRVTLRPNDRYTGIRQLVCNDSQNTVI